MDENLGAFKPKHEVDKKNQCILIWQQYVREAGAQEERADQLMSRPQHAARLGSLIVTARRYLHGVPTTDAPCLHSHWRSGGSEWDRDSLSLLTTFTIVNYLRTHQQPIHSTLFDCLVIVWLDGCYTQNTWRARVIYNDLVVETLRESGLAPTLSCLYFRPFSLPSTTNCQCKLRFKS
ncbi:hypothetical protein J6590_049909 [Homalodisca vitripennis]|nr:hypothetical protein J6590_049909 [Homalodisca vitripennis]